MKSHDGWFMIDHEQDEPMLRHASRPHTWHKNFSDHLLSEYFHHKQTRTAIDAGASYGWLTIGFARRFNSVHSLELRPDVFECLIENTKSYPNVIPYNLGVGDKAGTVRYHPSEVSGITTIDWKNQTEEDGTSVGNIITIDELELDEVDLIKLDVEGSEYRALRGAVDTIRKSKPLIVVEIHHARSDQGYQHRQNVFRFLRELNYQIADVRAADYVFDTTDRG